MLNVLGLFRRKNFGQRFNARMDNTHSLRALHEILPVPSLVTELLQDVVFFFCWPKQTLEIQLIRKRLRDDHIHPTMVNLERTIDDPPSAFPRGWRMILSLACACGVDQNVQSNFGSVMRRPRLPARVMRAVLVKNRKQDMCGPGTLISGTSLS